MSYELWSILLQEPYEHTQIVLWSFRDNPETDIYGGNLYNQYLRKRSLQRQQQNLTAESPATSMKKKLRLAQSDGEYISDDEDEPEEVERIRAPVIQSPVDEDEEAEAIVGDVAQQVVMSAEVENNDRGLYTEGCESILVCTGVFSEDMDLFSLQGQRPSNHNHRDFVINPDLKKPTHMAAHVLDAVKLVMEKEGADIRDLVKN